MSSRALPVALALLSLTCTPAGSAPDEMANACLRVAECSGVSGQEARAERECRDRLNAEYDEATGYGCGSAYSDWVSCLATTRGQCPSGDSDVDPCQGAQDAFRACQGRARRDECVVIGFGGGGGCDISCALFSGECSAPSTPDQSSTCSCRDGDKTGATFSGQCTSEALEASARDACQ